MRNAELEEIRALLRAQAEAAAAEPEKKGLFGLRRKSKSKQPLPPLNLTPVEPPKPAPSPRTEREPLDLETPAAPGEDAPMSFVAPRRRSFGLADEHSRAQAAPKLKLRTSYVAEQDELIELSPKKRGASLAAIEAAGVGADEIIELHDMLSERMPQLASRIDFDARLAESGPRSVDEPSIADVVGALEAVRATVERDASLEAWREAEAALRTLRADASAEATVRRRRLAGVHVDLVAHHADLEGDLHAVRRARSRELAKAA